MTRPIFRRLCVRQRAVIIATLTTFRHCRQPPCLVWVRLTHNIYDPYVLQHTGANPFCVISLPPHSARVRILRRSLQNCISRGNCQRLECCTRFPYKNNNRSYCYTSTNTRYFFPLIFLSAMSTLNFCRTFFENSMFDIGLKLFSAQKTEYRV